MHDFFEVFKTIGVVVSIARLILDLVKYINGHKKEVTACLSKLSGYFK